MDCRSIDFAKTASIDLMGLNNKVVNMRQVVRRTKVHVINKLCRQISALKKKKGTEEQKKKNLLKAERLLEEIDSIKKLKDDKVSKYSLANTRTFSEVCKESLSSGPRALNRLANHPLLAKVVSNFREQHPDWQDLAAFLLMKQTGRRFKTKKQKQKKLSKCIENMNAAETMTKAYIQERCGTEEMKKAEMKLKMRKKMETPSIEDGPKNEKTTVTETKSDNKITLKTSPNVLKLESGEKAKPPTSDKTDSDGDIDNAMDIDIKDIDMTPRQSDSVEIKNTAVKTEIKKDESLEDKNNSDTIRKSAFKVDTKKAKEVLEPVTIKDESVVKEFNLTSDDNILNKDDDLINDDNDIKNKIPEFLTFDVISDNDNDPFFGSSDNDNAAIQYEEDIINDEIISYNSTFVKNKINKSSFYNPEEKNYQSCQKYRKITNPKRFDVYKKSGSQPIFGRFKEKHLSDHKSGNMSQSRFRRAFDKPAKQTFSKTDSSPVKKQSEKLHPSWEASRKRKAEQSSMKAFKGQRITFDDDD